jgi:multicomponent K+:H+ antiporter subunit G
MTSADAVQAVAALLLVGSGLLALIAALGLVRLPDFFQRLHAPSLGNTLAAWCSCGASMLYFSALAGRPVLAFLALNLLLAITAPLATLLLARAALFRGRSAGASLPPPLHGDAAGNDGRRR